MLTLPCTEAREGFGSIICHLQAHTHTHTVHMCARAHTHTHTPDHFFEGGQDDVLGAERSKEYG